MVRYEVKPEAAADNEALVRAVYEELAATQPAGLSYVTFALDDGVGFVHIATNDTDDGRSPLERVPAFGRFQEGLRDRLVAPPTFTTIRTVGSYPAVDA